MTTRLPREIGWMRDKCNRLSEITNVMHSFLFDGETILFQSHGNNLHIIASGTFEDFFTFQTLVYKYYENVVAYYTQKNAVKHLVQPIERFISLGKYKRKVR